MNDLCKHVLQKLNGRTLVTAESCTGGGIGAALTATPGSSKVFKGGIISYTDWVKKHVLGVEPELLQQFGAVSQQVADAMAQGVRKLLKADVAVSVTGLAGPDGDAFGNAVGTVFIGYSCSAYTVVRQFCFLGGREYVREQAIKAALKMIVELDI